MLFLSNDKTIKWVVPSCDIDRFVVFKFIVKVGKLKTNFRNLPSKFSCSKHLHTSGTHKDCLAGPNCGPHSGPGGHCCLNEASVRRQDHGPAPLPLAMGLRGSAVS